MARIQKVTPPVKFQFFLENRLFLLNLIESSFLIDQDIAKTFYIVTFLVKNGCSEQKIHNRFDPNSWPEASAGENDEECNNHIKTRKP